MRPSRLALTSLLAASAFLTACGGSSDDSTPPPTEAAVTEAPTSAPAETTTTTELAPVQTGVSIVEGTTFSKAAGPVEVTVEGTAFKDFALGNRPPLDGLPTGVYVVFGWFDQNWKPSAGVGTDARRIVFETQSWALPADSRKVLDPDGTLPNVYTIDDAGNFSVKIPVDCSLAGQGTLGIAVYPASGAIQADHEFLIPITCTD